jgi:hypothetical protein
MRRAPGFPLPRVRNRGHPRRCRAAVAAGGAADPSAAKRHPAGFGGGIHAAELIPAPLALLPMFRGFLLNVVGPVPARLTAAPQDTASMRTGPRLADPLRPQRRSCISPHPLFAARAGILPAIATRRTVFAFGGPQR